MKLNRMAVFGVLLLASHAIAGEQETLKTQKEKASYTIGVDMGRNLRHQGIDLDLGLVIKGLKAGMAGETLLMTDQDLKATRKATQNEVMRRHAAQKQQRSKAKMSGEDNKRAGEAFLGENRTKEGVVVLPSGLQYKVLKAGEGKKPREADTVECHYRGTMIDGSMFGSSGRTGKPSTFKVADVIPGWREALLLMPVGSMWQLFVPSELAYGEQGAGRIGPNETLIFEVELVAIR